MNTIERNEAWNSFRGINLFNQQQVAGRYPGAPGAMPDTANNNRLMQPIAMTDNVVAANVLAGYEYWAMRRFPNDNLISAYNKRFQVMGVQSAGIDHWYRNPRLICQVGSRGSVGVHSSSAYTGTFEIEGGGQIAGCGIGISAGGGRHGLNLTGTVLQNVVNIEHAAPVGTIRERAASAAVELSASIHSVQPGQPRRQPRVERHGPAAESRQQHVGAYARISVGGQELARDRARLLAVLPSAARQQPRLVRR